MPMIWMKPINGRGHWADRRASEQRIQSCNIYIICVSYDVGW